MRFCYGTYEAIIDYGKRVSYVWKIRSLVARSVAPLAFDALSNRQNKLSDLAHGRDELLSEMVNTACETDPSAIASYFRDNVLSSLDEDKFKTMILALQDIVAKDDDIEPDTVVDIVNGLTKEQFIATKSFVFYRTLAGLFIYAVRRNNNRGCGDDVSLIDADYFRQFKAYTQSISLVEEDDSINQSQVSDLLSDIDVALARTQNRGVCPECTRPFIRTNEDGVMVDMIDYIIKPQHNPIPICVECKRKLTNGSSERIDELSTVQDILQNESRLIDISSSETPLRKDIIATLEVINDMDVDEATCLRDNPKRISEKIPKDKRLCSKIIQLVTPTYEGVQNILNDLSGQNRIDKERLGRQIKRMWENTQELSASQSSVFNTLVTNINAKSGYRYHEACEILISYYVQRCDVFAPAQ